MTDVLSTLTRDVLFAPLDAEGRTETVVNRLRTAVTLGVLADGNQLPNEVELAAQFNVAPGTLREALAILRDEGIVETRRGRAGGSFIRVPDSLHVSHGLAILRSMSPGDLRDSSDWRATIAGSSAYFAAERASDENVQTLAALADDLGTAPDEATARRYDTRFHIELAAAAQSRRLSTAAINLQVAYAPVLPLVYEAPQVRKDVGAGLREVAELVRSGAADQARRLAWEIADETGRRLLQLRAGPRRPGTRGRTGKVAK
ncbi:MAG: GntR family transcriptional regulator [Frankiales bacterium]|nr:GntR family transcriptional regulator [Frankiales bacterium]